MTVFVRLLVSCLALISSPAFAQDLGELPEYHVMPPEIQAVLDAQDGLLDRVRRWEGDLTGDGVPDQIVQAAFSFGGNAVTLQQWVFGATGDRFEVLSSLTIPEGIKAARVQGHDLTLTLYKHLPSDPACCPSGEQEMRLTLP